MRRRDAAGQIRENRLRQKAIRPGAPRRPRRRPRDCPSRGPKCADHLHRSYASLLLADRLRCVVSAHLGASLPEPRLAADRRVLAARACRARLPGRADVAPMAPVHPSAPRADTPRRLPPAVVARTSRAAVPISLHGADLRAGRAHPRAHDGLRRPHASGVLPVKRTVRELKRPGPKDRPRRCSSWQPPAATPARAFARRAIR